MPEGYLHLTCEQRCQIYALLQSGHSQAISRGKLASIRRRSAASLFATPARAAIASSKRTRRPRETRRGLGQAAQNDARFGGADRRKSDARAVEPRSDQRASGEGWRRLYQSRAHLSACLERQERRGHAVSSLASQRQKIQQAQGQEFGARADSEPRRYRSAASYCRRKKPHRRLGADTIIGANHKGVVMSHVERTSKYTKLAKLPDKNAELCRAGLRTRAFAAR